MLYLAMSSWVITKSAGIFTQIHNCGIVAPPATNISYILQKFLLSSNIYLCLICGRVTCSAPTWLRTQQRQLCDVAIMLKLYTEWQ